MNNPTLTIAQALQDMTVTKNYNSLPGLRELAETARIENAKYAKKNELITSLQAYYETTFSVKDTYACLSEPEKAVATQLARTGGELDYDEFFEIVDGYKWAQIEEQTSFFRIHDRIVSLPSYIEQTSPFWLLFPKLQTPSPLREELLEIVGETPRGEPVETLPEDAVVLERETQLGDYRTLVRYCNQGKFSLTKTNQPTKTALVGFWKEAGYRELTDICSQNASDASTIKKLRVGFPLYLTAISGGLIQAKGELVMPGNQAAELLARAPEVLAKKLFDGYQTNYRISETAFLQGIRERYSVIDYTTVRAFVVKQLSPYPVGTWFKTADFYQYVRAQDRHFLRKNAFEICYSGATDCICSWEEAEEPFLAFLLSVYGALGLLDLAWAPRDRIVPHIDTAEYEEQSLPVCFRITPLGAYAFGRTARYKAAVPQKNKLPGGFFVQPDFSLMLPESASRLAHELYLERFLTKVSTDAQMSIYHIDIDGILRLLNLGLTIAELLAYLEAGAENPIPDAVRRAFADWQEMAGKLRIRTVTILETDDPILLEEVVRYKGMEMLVQGRTGYGAVISPADTKKVKAIMEKNKRYCDDRKKR